MTRFASTRWLIAACAAAAASLQTGCGGGDGKSQPPTPTPGTLQFSAATTSVAEDAASAVVSITRVGGTSGAVSVTVTASASTAAVGTDFTATTTTVSFADGDAAAKPVAVPIVNDSTHESDETFTVTLSGVTGSAALGSPATITVTITDEDPATHSLGGSVSGLAGSGLVLGSAGGSVAVVGDGAFTFPTEVAEGASYSVTITTQPTNPSQTCVVGNGNGVIGTANVTNVTVTCPPSSSTGSGSLDTSFGNGGKVTTDFSGPA